MNPGDGLLSRPGDRDPEAADQRFLTFFLDGRSYGLPLAQVAEISPLRPLNRLPHMPRAVEGILELRGRVVPIMNLRERMSLPPWRRTARAPSSSWTWRVPPRACWWMA